MAERLLANLDDTNPYEVIAKLPLPLRAYYLNALLQATKLPPMMARAREREAWIELLVLSHNLIKLSLRLLYVFSWQRAVERPLSEDDVRDFFDGYSRKADVYDLVGVLRKGKLLDKVYARSLWDVNDWRNEAVHGLTFGQIDYADLRDKAERGLHVALAAMKAAVSWLDNPRPLEHVLI